MPPIGSVAFLDVPHGEIDRFDLVFRHEVRVKGCLFAERSQASEVALVELNPRCGTSNLIPFHLVDQGSEFSSAIAIV
jgi:hypothetical protein